MRFRGMMLALSLTVWGCGDDSGGGGEGDSDGSVDASASDSQVPTDARRLDGGPDGSTGDDSGYVPGPLKAEFALESSSGVAPLFERATSSATGSIETLYDWGEGAGFEPSNTHRYKTGGTFTVKQQVKGTDGALMVAMQTVTVTTFTPVRFSATDKTSKLLVTGDGYELEQLGLEQSAGRSDDSIKPGSGIFYFESHRLAERFYRGAIGIATAASPLAFYFDQTFDKNVDSLVYLLGDGTTQTVGGACSGAAKLDVAQRDLGFVVDYRGASPIVKLLQDVNGAATVLTTCTLPVTTPVFVFFAAERAIVGTELRINTGRDTTNFPFHFADAAVRAALTASGDAAGAAALVMGFGRTNAARKDSPPVLVVPADSTVALGQPVTLMASATDDEDGSLDAQISWVDTSLSHHLWTPARGNTFTFTAGKLGVHPIVVKVQDQDGVVVSKTVTITVTGALPMPSPVQLVSTPADMAQGVVLSPDKLSASFNTNGKIGIRANQGILGQYWYFEVRRNNPTRNIGMGLVIEDGEIVPYESEVVPWSASINVLGTGSVYHNLILQPGGDWQVGDVDQASYGFAVDFRGLHPLLHLIIGNKVQTTVKLDDIWVPIYPMLYGNGFPPAATPFDYTINFGATPFAQDPRAALTTAGVDATGFKLGWGVHAQ